MREGFFRLPPNPTPQQKQQLRDWAIGVWGRHATAGVRTAVYEHCSRVLLDRFKRNVAAGVVWPTTM
jgi:hypothetical protein